jgi:ADP-ribose pyrophosphatase YjhB (NUDIX family)
VGRGRAAEGDIIIGRYFGEAAMASEDVRSLLLEDYKHCSAGMAKSEQAGEARLTFFIGLVTFCASAVGAGYAKDSKILPHMHELALAVALALLATGTVILFRMITRNEKTDLAKAQLDLIRQTFTDHFDRTQMLARYDLFLPSGGRKLGGLTDIVAAVNGILLASVVFFACLVSNRSIDSNTIVIVSSAAIIWFVAQREYVRARVEKYKSELKGHFPKFTHAGGVVYTIRDGVTLFLVVRALGNEGGWVLPKGHIEDHEKPGEAALREVGEEARVFARIVCPVGTAEFVRKKARVRTKFYLMRKIGDIELLYPEKPRDICWLPASKARDLLTFEESKVLIDRALELI